MNYMAHFGEKSAEYRQFRPQYPDELYHYLNSKVNQHDLAWDCGTGNGQAAFKLADYFTQVVATDLNQAQLDMAMKKENIRYFCCSAEKTPLDNQTIDLITVAQALHWFNLDEFYLEVMRVLKPDGILAAWCYSLGKINEEMNKVILKIYDTILGDQYWPKERRYIDAEYKTIPFPFTKISTPTFEIKKEMNFFALIGYLNTWSAVKEYQKINQHNPLNFIYSDLQKIWGDPEKMYTMTWPIHLLLGKIP